MQVKTAGQCITSVEALAADDEVSVYPNPSVGAFTVNIPVGLTLAHMEVTDVTGKTVMSETLPQAARELHYNLNAVVPGVYMLRIESDGKLYRKRIVITK
jgi:hypothetical protein